MKMMFIFSVSDKGDSEKMNLKSKRLLWVPAKSQRVFLLPNKTLHNLWFQFLLGISVVPRENEDNGYAKFWGGKQDVLCMSYVKMVTENSLRGMWG